MVRRDEGGRRAPNMSRRRRVELSRGVGGFDFLGCHLRKRMSGPIREKERKRVYFLQRWPSRRSMKRVRERVRELTPRSACHRDLRDVIAQLNPVLRGWGNYFRAGNASEKFRDVDRHVYRRLHTLRVKRAGRQLRAGEADRWDEPSFHALGLRKLLGSYVMLHRDRPPVSRVREIRMHGLKGGLALVPLADEARAG